MNLESFTFSESNAINWEFFQPSLNSTSIFMEHALNYEDFKGCQYVDFCSESFQEALSSSFLEEQSEKMKFEHFKCSNNVDFELELLQASFNGTSGLMEQSMNINLENINCPQYVDFTTESFRTALSSDIDSFSMIKQSCMLSEEALGQEQQEVKEFEEMKPFQFHAKPVDSREYKSVHIEKMYIPVTRAKNVQLKAARRKTANEKSRPENISCKFCTSPIVVKVFADITRLGEKSEVIHPKLNSPNFQTYASVRKRKRMGEMYLLEDFPTKKRKIKIIPDEQKKTKQGKPKFYAIRRMPSTVFVLPEIKKKQITVSRPFNFCLNQRNLKCFLSKEENFAFKAQPATVLTKIPFVPKQPSKFSIKIQEFNLRNDARALERILTKERKFAEEIEKEKMVAAQKAQKEKKERDEIFKLRKGLVHKPNPIRKYKPIILKKSSKPITVPISPHLETYKRLQSRCE